MKKVILLVCVLSAVAFADQELSPHSLSINLGGPGSAGYFEYQNVIFKGQKSNVCLSGGMGLKGNGVVMPIGLVYTRGTKNQFLFGFHYTPFIDRGQLGFDPFTGILVYLPPSPQFVYLSGSVRFGFRRTFKIGNENYFIQGYISPGISVYDDDINYYHGIGLGFGTFL